MNDKNDALLEELKNLNDDLKSAADTIPSVDTPMVDTTTPSVSTAPITPVVPALTNENLSDFILAKSQEIINSGLTTITALKNDISMTFDARAMSGFAEIVNATNSAIDTLNKINIEQHKSKTARELKIMDITAKKELIDKKKPNVNNNLTIVAGREEIMKMLKAADVQEDNSRAIDVEVVEIPNN